jgi:hypothetical protein
MKWAKLFKQGPPYAETRQKLRSAIKAGNISEDADAATALRPILDSLDVVELALAMEERGEEGDLSAHTVRELLSQLDRLDREYELEHKKELPK